MYFSVAVLLSKMPEGLDEFASKYKVHSESLAYLEIQQAGGIDITDDSIPLDDRRRKTAESSSKLIKDAEEFAGTVKEFRVPSAALPGTLGVRVRVGGHVEAAGKSHGSLMQSKQ